MVCKIIKTVKGNRKYIDKPAILCVCLLRSQLDLKSIFYQFCEVANDGHKFKFYLDKTFNDSEATRQAIYGTCDIDNIVRDLGLLNGDYHVDICKQSFEQYVCAINYVGYRFNELAENSEVSTVQGPNDLNDVSLDDYSILFATMLNESLEETDEKTNKQQFLTSLVEF